MWLVLCSGMANITTSQFIGAALAEGARGRAKSSLPILNVNAKPYAAEMFMTM